MYSYTFMSDGTKIIQTGEEMVICDPASCFAMPAVGGEAMMMGFLGPFALGVMQTGVLGETPGFDVETEAVTIAGRAGICVTYIPSAAIDPDVEGVRQCVDNEFGFTLLLESTDRGASVAERAMLLIEFDRPRPEDFEPTGPVADMPGG